MIQQCVQTHLRSHLHSDPKKINFKMVSNLGSFKLNIVVFWFLIFCLLVFVTFAHCPNSCNGRGTCGTGDECICEAGFHGPDCSKSISNIPLPNLYSSTSIRTFFEQKHVHLAPHGLIRHLLLTQLMQQQNVLGEELVTGPDYVPASQGGQA